MVSVWECLCLIMKNVSSINKNINMEDIMKKQDINSTMLVKIRDGRTGVFIRNGNEYELISKNSTLSQLDNYSDDLLINVGLDLQQYDIIAIAKLHTARAALDHVFNNTEPEVWTWVRDKNIPKKFNDGDKYCFSDITSVDLFDFSHWFDDEVDNHRLDNDLIFDTEEGCIERSKEILKLINGEKELGKSEIFWDDFMSGKVAVNCETMGETKLFLKKCDERGLEWQDGYKAGARHPNVGGGDTCYAMRSDNALGWCDKQYYISKGLNIITHKSLVSEGMI